MTFMNRLTGRRNGASGVANALAQDLPPGELLLGPGAAAAALDDVPLVLAEEWEEELAMTPPAAVTDDARTFLFGKAPVRVVLCAGEPWFVLADVTTVLGYRMASDGARLLPDEERGTYIVRTPGGPQDMVTASEGGLYRLIFSCRRDEAEAFRKWVFKEVLPAIRRTGGYGAVQPAPLPAPPPEVTLPRDRYAALLGHPEQVTLPLADYTRLLEAAVARAGGPALVPVPAQAARPPRTPLTPEQRAARTAEVRRLASEGVSNNKIAKVLDMDGRRVWHIVRGTRGG